MNIAFFIYDINNQGFILWADGEKVRYRQYKESANKDAILHTIQSNKKEILEFLIANNCHMPNTLNQRHIYKTNSNNEALSFAQERLWFIDKYERGTNAYNVPIIFALSNNINIIDLENSLKNIINRHEVLRTLIKESNDGSPYQSVQNNEEFSLHIAKKTVKSQLQLEEEIGKLVYHIFDLKSECPIKIGLFELISNDINQESNYYISIVIHHIAFDGWSVDVFLRELEEYYRYYSNKSKGINAELNLPELSIQYKDFAVWQRSYLKSEKLKEDISYWKDGLAGFETLNLKTDKPRPTQIDYRGSDLNFTIDEATSLNLRELAKGLNVSLYTILLSAYYLMLRAYSNQDDITIGVPVSNRHYNQVENLLGFFVNSLALRTKIDSALLIKDYIQQVGKETIEAQLHQDLPFEKLVEELKVPKDTSRNPIFQVLFVVQSFGSTDFSDLLEKYQPIDEIYKIAKFEISTYIDDSQTALKGSFNYATSIYNETTIADFLKTYKQILQQFANLAMNLANQDQFRIKDIEYLDAAEYERIINAWNNTDREYPKDKTICQLFEEQVERTPNSIAVVCEDTRLTYAELNNQSNQFAHYISQQAIIEPDTLISICLDRTEHMLIGIMGILKAGAAYVPMDLSYPDERIRHILTDTKTQLIITNRIHKERLENIAHKNGLLLKVIAIDSKDIQDELSHNSIMNPVTKTQSTDLAYVIYTSGTTGNPKGVMLEHKGIINRIMWMNNTYPINENDIVLQKTPYVFDVSVWELFWANWHGASVVFAKPDGHKDSNYLIDLIKKRNITIIHFVPSMLSAFIDAVKINIDNSNRSLHSLRYIFCSGEALDIAQVKACHTVLPQTEIHNLYGPTEASIDVLYYNCAHKNLDNVYIGKPIDNTSCYVLDPDLIPLPVGAIGELHIGGDGLARGYLNQSEMTKTKFIINPFQTETKINERNNSLIYKTGDLVRYLADGTVEYLGRKDDQIKIRGYRIELEEIASALEQISFVSKGLALVNERLDSNGKSAGNKHIVGYYLTHDQEPRPQAEMLAHLFLVLPQYMLPTRLIHLIEIPLTVNGKIDKNALLQNNIFEPRAFAAPKNRIEEIISRIWAEVLILPLEKISIYDNFFDLGGNSILILKVKNKIESELALDAITVVDFFKYTTIHSFAEYLNNKKSNTLIQRHVSNKKQHAKEIAVIGMSGAFSGSNNITEYWNNLVNGLETLKHLSIEECKRLNIPEAILNDANFIPVGGTLDDIDKFDPDFWNISHNDAILLDPHIRKFLEHSYNALEQSGYALERHSRSIGVFAGMASSQYYQRPGLDQNNKLLAQLSNWEKRSLKDQYLLATKVSYLLGLTGISLNINTACSTSLVAVVEACKNLEMGVCDLALAGGVSLTMPADFGEIFQEGMIISNDGHCRVFDQNASGTIGGSGVGIVVLKRLNEAIEDKDNIVAVIKGYATNNDGNRKVGYTAPSVIGQAECIRAAHNNAQISADTIGYVECHGTGTILGDPIEIAALNEAFTENSDHEGKCYIGAVKANIGHTDTAAGVAGMIKACKILQTKVIPPQINFNNPNKNLNLDQTNFQILTKKTHWSESDVGQRRAGVSAFGIGGTNVHVVLEEYEAKKEDNLAQSNKYYIFPISARSEYSYAQYCQALINYLKSASEDSLENIAYTLQYKRERFKYRNAFVCSTKQELIECLIKNATQNSINHAPHHNVYLYQTASAWVQGHNVNWVTDGSDKSNMHTAHIPGYQFQKISCWLDDHASNSPNDAPSLSPVSNIENRLIEEEASDIEEKIAELFFEVLGCSKFSKYSSYFALGGNSLSAIRLAKKMSAVFETKVSVSILLKFDSVYKLAEYWQHVRAKINDHQLAAQEGEL